MMERPGADSEEKHEPVSDIDTVVVDSLKVLDSKWPIREEADVGQTVRFTSGPPIRSATPVGARRAACSVATSVVVFPTWWRRGVLP
jgi:hypothetical protein